MRYYIGIDGGGSNLRVALVDETMHLLREVVRGKTNPNVLGLQQASERVQQALREITADFAEPIRAVGIGIAGAPKAIAENWLRDTVKAALPLVEVVPSSDEEIALVGANGERRGVLVLAGTGSIAYGVNDAGEALTVGGWGYLLGDKGSGYWLGMQALEAYLRHEDGLDTRPTSLVERVRQACGFRDRFDVIPWLYQPAPDSSKVASLAPLVLEEAQAGDAYARHIVEEAATELALLAQTIVRRLRIDHPRYAFAGSLLTNPTPLAEALCRRLHLPTPPQPRYSPLIGAALLARLTVDPL
ncbi:BadF/BadG/BcrA/BcrD ATPase family protein (plasmid) [Aggregatilineales bacterium SYSU G02658]